MHPKRPTHASAATHLGFDFNVAGEQLLGLLHKLLEAVLHQVGRRVLVVYVPLQRIVLVCVGCGFFYVHICGYTAPRLLSMQALNVYLQKKYRTLYWSIRG